MARVARVLRDDAYRVVLILPSLWRPLPLAARPPDACGLGLPRSNLGCTGIAGTVWPVLGKTRRRCGRVPPGECHDYRLKVDKVGVTLVARDYAPVRL